MERANYTFPVTNRFEAREVLDTDFDMDKYKVREQLFVHIEEYRGDYKKEDIFSSTYWEEILQNLRIEDDELKQKTNEFKKILLWGHRGCGKTTEIRRLHAYLNHPSRYYAILFEIEKDLEPFKMQPQDFYIMLLIKLIRRLEEDGLGKLTNLFDEILNNWFQEKEIVEEISEREKLEGNASASVGASFLDFFKLKLDLKALLASESKTTEILRTKIKQTLPDFIKKFNIALIALQNEIAKANKGKDICFVIDGAEKTSGEVYEDIFQKNGQFLREVNANMVSTITLSAFSKLSDKNELDFFEQVYLPMVKVDSEEKKAKMKEIISKRIDLNLFFEEKAIEKIITISGGSFRQLIRMTNQSIFKAHKLLKQGEKVPLDAVDAVIKDERQRYMDALSKEQKEILKNKTWNDDKTNPIVTELFFSLVILKYNGDTCINPILAPFVCVK